MSWEEPGTAVSATENTFMLKDWCGRCQENSRNLGIWKELIDIFHFTDFRFQQATLVFIQGQSEP